MKKNYAAEFASLFEKTSSSAFSNLSIEEMEAQFLSTERVEKTAETLPSKYVDVADEWGREMARGLFEKTALNPVASAMGSVMGPMRRGVGTALNYASHASTMQRMGVGAAIGGVMGGMRNPGLDPQTGMPRSRMGGMMSGATMGGLAGYAAKPAAQAIMGAKGPMGQMAQGAAARGKMPGGTPSPKGRGSVSARPTVGTPSGGRMIPMQEAQAIYSKIPDATPGRPVPLINSNSNTAHMHANQVPGMAADPIPRTQVNTNTLNRPYSSGPETQKVTKSLKPKKKKMQTESGSASNQTYSFARPR